MKKIYLLACILIVFSISGYSQSAFTAGNLVVYTVGDGTDTLSSAPFAISVDEYTTNGTFVQSHPMPTTVVGSNRRIVGSGSATSEGLMTRSADKRFLIVPGYDTFPDPARASISSSISATVNRVVGIVDATGAIDATTALTDAFSGNNFRSATSSNGTDLWVSGNGSSSSSGGIRHTTKGSPTSTQISTTITNTRGVDIFNGQLYCSAQSKTFYGLCQDGTGLPTTTGQTITLLPGFPAGTPSTASPYAFSISPSGDTAYVGDGGAIDTQAPVDSLGGVQKWTFNGTTWTMAYILTNGLTTGIRNLTVDWSGTNPIIYATSDETPGSNQPGNTIVKVIDAGASSTFTTIATAGVNKIMRGIAFAPESGTTPVTLTSFKALSITNAVQLEWATSQEINTKDFEIEKSTDGIHFSLLATLTAAGNSSLAHSYQTIDKNPSAGINYYRLKTVDANGQYSYSNIVSIKYAAGTISVYPNPASDQITISHPVSINAILVITDIEGRKIKALNINSGSTTNKVSVNELSKGQYILKYVDDGVSSINVLTKE